jgi:hypothetical protein
MKNPKSSEANFYYPLVPLAICFLAITGCSGVDASRGFHTALIGKTGPQPQPGRGCRDSKPKLVPEYPKRRGMGDSFWVAWKPAPESSLTEGLSGVIDVCATKIRRVYLASREPQPTDKQPLMRIRTPLSGAEQTKNTTRKEQKYGPERLRRDHGPHRLG